MTTSTYLIPQDAASTVLDSTIDKLFTAYNTAFASANTLALQPAFSTKLLPTLPEDQALAAAHATTFINGWGFGVANSFLSGMGSAASFVSNLLKAGLLPLARLLDNTKLSAAQRDSSLASFRTYIGIISATCCQTGSGSQSILLGMQSIHDKLAALGSQIDDDRTRLDTAVNEVTSEAKIQQLASQQKALQSQFADVNGQIASGATSTIASDIEFGFSFGKEFLEGINPGAIAGSVLEVAGEADAIEAFNAQVKGLLDQQSQLGAQIVALMATIAQDQEDQLALTLAAAQVDIFANQIQGLLAYTGSILSQMAGWANQLGLLAELTSPPEPCFYEAQVAAGQAFWSELYASVGRYQRILALSTR